MKIHSLFLAMALTLTAGSAFSQNYHYDDAGRLGKVLYSNGKGVAYSYDILDNLTRVESITVPRAVEGLSIAPLSQGKAQLTWKHSGEGTLFLVQKQVVGTEDWINGASVDINARVATVTIPFGQEQRFRIVVIGSSGDIQSSPSPSVQLPSDSPLLVTTLVDENDHALGRGRGDSLRELIEVAIPGDIIRFDPHLGVVYVLYGFSGFQGDAGPATPAAGIPTILLGGTQLKVDKNLTIDASVFPGGVRIDAGGQSRVIFVSGDNTVVLKGLTLTGGRSDSGAGLQNDGASLSLVNCVLSGNEATAEGGAIKNVNGGSLSLLSSTIRDNAADEGGGIFNGSGGSLLVGLSTFSRNSAEDGGGIYNRGTPFVVDRSTFSGNAAFGSGGGIVNLDATGVLENSTLAGNVSGSQGSGGLANLGSGDMTLRQCTIADNNGGGVFNESPATLHLDNSIVANNFDLLNSPQDLTGGVTAVGANLVRVHSGALLGGTAFLTDDPVLGPLASYGGPTHTMPPLVGSPVIDAGVAGSDTPSTDQQNAFRPNGSAPDIGSIESRLSGDTNLEWLTSSAGTLRPTFRASLLSYAVTVPNQVTSAAVRPAGSHFGQTIEVRINGGAFTTVDSKAASDELPLAAGENAIEVRVTAQNGSTNKTYTLTVVRDAPLAANARIATLSSSAGALSPVFDPARFFYSAAVSNATTTTTVSASTASPSASLEVRSNHGVYTPFLSGQNSLPLALNIGDNAIDIRVTAADGVTTSLYTVIVTREASSAANANLAALSVSAGALSPVFSRGLSFYEVTVGDDVTSSTVTATTSQLGSTLQMRVNGNAVTPMISGQPSDSFVLNGGVNVIEIKVAAENGVSVMAYTVIVTRVIDDLGSVSANGNGASGNASLSADCRYLAYSSRATNLVAGDTNNKEDVFVLDRTTAITERVSVDANGNQGNFDSSHPTISADGRYVAFESEATNLVPNDTNGDIDRSAGQDIFVYDRDMDTIERISLTDSGGQANQASESPSISGDGRYVAFASGANNLVSGYANGEVNVYVYDRSEDAVVGVTVPFGNLSANRNSLNPAISSDGNFVAFEFSVDKSVGSTPGYQYRDVYIYNRATQGVERISGTLIGLEADGTLSGAPSISADGRFTVFESNLENLDFYDTNAAVDIFIHDRIDGSIRRISSNGAEGGEAFRDSTHPSISGDGRYVVFESQASNLVPSDTNGSTDVFLKDLQNGKMSLVSRNSAGVQGNADSFLPSVSHDGRCVAFQSHATNLKSNDTNDSSDVFVAYTEELPPSPVADLAFLASNLGAVRSGENSYSAGVADGVAIAILRPIVADSDGAIRMRVNSGAFIPLSSDGEAQLPLEPGTNTISIEVTASDRTTTRTYTLTLDRVETVPLLSANADLASLVPSAGILSPVLTGATSIYTVNVTHSTTSIRITPTVADPNATLTINGATVASGSASSPISLGVGSNAIITTVTAEDGVSTKSYALAVTREPKATDLYDLSPSYGFLEPAFAAGTTAYSLVAPYFVSEISFIPTAAVEGATVMINGTSVEAGSSSSAISLAVGENTITSVVTASGGGSIETYSVVVTRAEEPTEVPDSRLSNLSVRTTLATSQRLIVGFVMQGGGKEVLVRVAGPAMNNFGLSGLPDPRLELFDSTSTLVSSNEDWPSELSVVFTALGAFDFTPGSLDAAFLQNLSGPHTVHVKGAGAGLVLVEAYDAGTGTDLRLVNLSARNRVGTGPDILIAGFVIEGTGTKTLLIRGIGPKLTDFGVGNVLADPLVGIFDASNTKIAENDDWEASLADTFTALGAFDLPVGSKDAALVVTLPAGASYTVKLRGADGGTGQALVEIYEVE